MIKRIKHYSDHKLRGLVEKMTLWYTIMRISKKHKSINENKKGIYIKTSKVYKNNVHLTNNKIKSIPF